MGGKGGGGKAKRHSAIPKFTFTLRVQRIRKLCGKRAESTLSGEREPAKVLPLQRKRPQTSGSRSRLRPGCSRLSDVTGLTHIPARAARAPRRRWGRARARGGRAVKRPGMLDAPSLAENSHREDSRAGPRISRPSSRIADRNLLGDCRRSRIGASRRFQRGPLPPGPARPLSAASVAHGPAVSRAHAALPHDAMEPQMRSVLHRAETRQALKQDATRSHFRRSAGRRESSSVGERPLAGGGGACPRLSKAGACGSRLQVHSRAPVDPTPCRRDDDGARRPL